MHAPLPRPDLRASDLLYSAACLIALALRLLLEARPRSLDLPTTAGPES